MKNTTINIYDENKSDNGFYYNDELGISIPESENIDSNKCIC
jgi:hypothetical protein